VYIVKRAEAIYQCGEGMSRLTSLFFYLFIFGILLPGMGGCSNRRARVLLQAQTPSLLGVVSAAEVPPEPEVFQPEPEVLEYVPEYVIGVEDVLDIHVWKNETLSRVVLVRPDGKISLPLIGDVQAAGLVPIQLRDAIKTRLKAYQETPEVSVILKEIGSFSVFVMGEVEHPGKLQLRSHITLLQALTLVGGFTRFADHDNILLLRKQGGDEIRMRIRYRDIITGRNPDHNVQLERNDTIVVP
jgi:polysaccharide export outer membrane protein